ncbi:hypothetical protein EDC04DRAFT_2605927 [Pisolithus marmoratus]|nr:hypothetical protein EDC04DRAFT_2605927 [Pisolithus marmoratus]
MQLEKVGHALAQPQQMPRQWVVLPDDEPWNVLAPTPCHQRKVPQPSQKGQKCKNAAMEKHIEDSGTEVDSTAGPLPKFQRAKPGSIFGFQVKNPKQPSFIGTQPLNKYEQDQARHQAHQTTKAAAPQAQAQTIAPQATGEPNSGDESHDLNEGSWDNPNNSTADEDASGHADNDRMDEDRQMFSPAYEESNDCPTLHPNLEVEMDAGSLHESDDELGLDDHTGTPQSPQHMVSLGIWCPCSLVQLLLSGLPFNLSRHDHKLHLNMHRTPHCLIILTNVRKVSLHVSPLYCKVIAYDPIMACSHMMNRLVWTMMSTQGITPGTIIPILPLLHTLRKLAAMAKANVVVWPTTLAFFGPLWCKLLDEVKGRIWLYVTMEAPFLHHKMAINSICMEVLVEMVIKYEEDGLELKTGYYPEHKRSMVMILFNDTQTFHSKIKKVAICIVPFEYCLYPPKNIEDNAEWIEFIKKKAMQLLEGT